MILAENIWAISVPSVKKKRCAMAVLYLVEQNTILRKSGERLLLCSKPPVNRYSPGVREDDILVQWPLADIDHVMVYGNIQITTQTVHLLLAKNIELAIFTLSGELLGQISPPCGRNIFLRIEQHKRREDAEFRLAFAKMIVESKIANALAVLRGYARNHPGTVVSADLAAMEKIREKVALCGALDSLLGHEGSASAIYFKCLGQLPPPAWKFNGRSRQPPKDAANAVLSFGYTVLANELCSLIDGVGLDPGMGFYHEVSYGRPSLALDLLELFRHPLIDRLMLTLFNRGSLGKDDFRPVAEGGIYLSDDGKRNFFAAYEHYMGEYKDDIPGENEALFRNYFQNQVALLCKAIKGEAAFEPYRLKI